MPMQMASPGAVVDDGKIILVGGRMGQIDESRQNLGLAMSFDPVKAEFS